MTEFTFGKAKWSMDSEGTWLMLLCKEQTAAKQFCEQKKDRPYTARLKEDYERRSLDANAYLWVLCDRIAREIRSTKELVYREAIRRVGVFEYCLLPDKALEGFIRQWEGGGLGNIAEVIDGSKVERCTRVRIYYGSSTYDKREMSRLIDEIVTEAKALGVETWPPDKLTVLLERWGNDEADEGA